MNKVIALILTFLLLPFFLLVAIAIYLEDGFPIIYKQKKYGKNNLVFNLYKFRTMKVNTPLLPTENFVNTNDYILKTGNLLRKSSIDELPQLLNIILGQMNFVGPRPILISPEESLVNKLRVEKKINSIKPGITGWAQVNGRDLNSFEEKVNYDEYYFKNQSIMLDIKIIILTFKTILLSKNIKH